MAEVVESVVESSASRWKSDGERTVAGVVVVVVEFGEMVWGEKDGEKQREVDREERRRDRWTGGVCGCLCVCDCVSEEGECQ